MKKDVKFEIVSCEICGHPVKHYETHYEYCPKCGWRRGCDNAEMERQQGISYPMLVSLSRAKEQYKNGQPFKASFDEFIRGLFFYSEMLFDYKDKTYEVYLYGKHWEEPYIIEFYCHTENQKYNSKEDFYNKANIDGKLLKDIWDDVTNPRYM